MPEVEYIQVLVVRVEDGMAEQGCLMGRPGAGETIEEYQDEGIHCQRDAETAAQKRCWYDELVIQRHQCCVVR